MSINATEAARAAALNAYSNAQTGTVTDTTGVFSTLLQSAITTDTAAKATANVKQADAPKEAEKDAAETQGKSKAASQSNELTSLLPLLLSSMGGMSGGSWGSDGSSTESSLLMALMLIAMQGSEGMEGLDSETMSSLPLLAMSGGLGSALGSTGGIGAAADASNLAMMAAMQSLSKAYSNKAAGAGSAYAVTDQTAGASGTTGTSQYSKLLAAIAGSNGYAPSYIKSAGSAASATTGYAASATNEHKVTATMPTAAGKPTTPVITSTVANRDPARYRAVIDQFDVENSQRYAVNRKGTGDTYCNIYLWDVTSAMGAEIPHYTDWETGEPRIYPDTAGAKAMNANRISGWLNKYGQQYGWYEVSAEQAQALANQGRPAVTVWKNESGGHGHVQVVCPSQDGQYDESRGVSISQAGRLLHDYTYIRKIYSTRMKDVQYFAHA